jgi:predicted Zn-dependent protease
LQFGLGVAYLNIEDATKSRTAFETALKLDSNPIMLNNIAYRFAEQNTDLDEAREYAEKAVHQAEEASAKTQLSELQTSDLNHPRQLAMFWDTLGWVYYRRNDLTSAEGYLKAAWTLSQSSVIGEHLGRVYEQQRKKGAALRTYQLAYTASPLLPMSSLSVGTPVFKKDASALEQDIHRLGGRPDSSTFMAELNHMRTIKLPRVVSSNTSAEFFVLLSPSGKVEAKFISGSDSLKSVQKTLESTTFDLKFPDDHPTKVLRRGIVGCYQYTGCSLVLMPPDTVLSIQ